MNCRQARSALPAYIDADLYPAAQREVQDHLDTCEACRAECASFEDLTSLCADLMEFTGTPYAYESLLPRLAEIDPLGEIIEFVPRVRVRRTVPRIAVAALFLILSVPAPALFRTGRHVYQGLRSPFSERAARLDIYLDEAWARSHAEDDVPGAHRSA